VLEKVTRGSLTKGNFAVFICYAELRSEFFVSRIRKVAAIQKSHSFSEAVFYTNSFYVI
jgi:hypothetical protein